MSDFALADHTEEAVTDALGTGRRHRLVGRGSGLEKTVEISFYDDFPQAAVLQTTYANVGTAPVTIASWTQNRYAIAATDGAAEHHNCRGPRSGPTRALYEPRPD